jgi:hypothetical protein
MKCKIYVASSWRNVYYPEVVAKLREAGHEVYDLKTFGESKIFAYLCSIII